jgi:membrane protease YdiL (CAAX protease family)
MISNHLYTVALQTGPMALLGIILVLSSASREIALKWVLIAVGLILIEDVLLTSLWLTIPQPAGWGQWNWTGKALALGGSLLLATLPWFGLDAVGLRLYQAEGSGLAWIACGVVCVGIIATVLLFGGNPYQGTDTLIYQAGLAAPEEEIFYRGILFVALDRAFLERREVYGAKVGPAVLLTALYFAMVHGLSRGHGVIDVRPILFGTYLMVGLFLGWVRARTGSLLAPIGVHMLGNAVLAVF